jgi:hypothetical protein
VGSAGLCKVELAHHRDSMFFFKTLYLDDKPSL